MNVFLRFLNVLALFLVSQIWSLVLGVNLVLKQVFAIQSGSIYDILLQVLVVLSALGSVWLTSYLAKKTDIPQPRWKGWTKKDTGLAIGAALGTTALARLGIYLLHVNKIESTANDAMLNELFADFQLPLLFILVAICGPILEEWVFRGGIIGHLFEKRGWIGVIVSSIFFGAMHMPTNAISWMIYGGIGAILSLIYYKTKRLEVVMAIHILHNALSFIG